MIQAARLGYTRKEPKPADGASIGWESSQVLGKPFAALAEDGVARGDVAAELAVTPAELDALISGLTLRLA